MTAHRLGQGQTALGLLDTESIGDLGDDAPAGVEGRQIDEPAPVGVALKVLRDQVDGQAGFAAAPGPRSVNNRVWANRAAARASSASRPTKSVRGTGPAHPGASVTASAGCA